MLRQPFVTILLCSSVLVLHADTARFITPDTMLIDGKRIAAARAQVVRGDEAVKPTIDAMESGVKKLLEMTPVSVMDKGVTPPSGDKHDYMSQAPYFWPDPSKPDGKPYIRKDGQTNPEIKKISDHDNLGRLCSAVNGLGLAYAITGKQEYATQAAKLVRVWFLDPATKMNPHLKFGQGIPGINEGRGIGIIETRGLPELLDGVTLISHSPAWSAADQAGLQAWMREFAMWLTESQFGKDESQNGNNHETWYEVQVTALALWTGQMDLAKRTLERGQASIAKQIQPDGRMPRELERTNSWSYSIFNVDAFLNLAKLGTRAGVDVLNYRTRDGRSLRQALDYLVPFATGEKKWPAEQINEFRPAQLTPALRKAAVAWNEPRYRELGKQLGGSNPTLDLLVP
jgi:hypothetical protein